MLTGQILGEVKKLYHKPGAGAIAFTCEIAAFETAAKWIFNGAVEKDRPEILSKMQWVGCYLTVKGEIFRAAHDEPLHKVHRVCYMGSGYQIAMGAYFISSDPVKSVEASMGINCYTGGEMSMYVSKPDRAVRAFVMNDKGEFEDDGCV